MQNYMRGSLDALDGASELATVILRWIVFPLSLVWLLSDCLVSFSDTDCLAAFAVPIISVVKLHEWKNLSV